MILAIDAVANWLPVSWFDTQGKDVSWVRLHAVTLAARGVFSELALAYSANAIVGTLVATTASMAIFAHVVTVMSIGLASCIGFALLGTVALRTLGFGEGAKRDISQEMSDKLTRYIASASEIAQCSLVDLALCAGPAAVVHELGHVVAGLVLLRDSSPQMRINPFKGGHVTFAPTASLGLVGGFLGFRWSLVCILSAGAVAITVVASAILVGSCVLYKENPGISECLRRVSVVMVAQECLDAWRSYMSPAAMAEGDYCMVRNITGISPLAWIVAMVASLVVAMFLGHRYAAKQPATTASA